MKTDDYLKAYLLIRRGYSIAKSLEQRAQSGERRAESAEQRAESGERRAESVTLLLSLCLYSLNQLLERLKVPNRSGPPEKIPVNTDPGGLLNEGKQTVEKALLLLDPITTPGGMAPAPYHDLLLVVMRLREVRWFWKDEGSSERSDKTGPERNRNRMKDENLPETPDGSAELELDSEPAKKLSKTKRNSKAAGADASENPAT